MQEKKKPITPKLMFIFITVIFVASMFAIVADQPREETVTGEPFEYGGHTFFELATGSVATRIHFKDVDQTVYVEDPRKLQDIVVNANAVERLANSTKVYVAYNPNQNGAYEARESAQNIGAALSSFYSREVIIAYTEDTDPIDPVVPVKNCASSTKEVPVVVLTQTSSNSINLDENCIIVSGKTPESLKRAAGKLVLWLIGMQV